MNFKAITSLLLLSAVLLPVTSQANLTLYNATNRPSTSYLNLGVCSTILPKFGRTDPGQTNVIPHGKLLTACGFSSVCTAVVFVNANCDGAQSITDYSQVGRGDSVALVSINTANDTIISVDDHFSHYRIYGPNGYGSSAVGSSYAMLVDTNLNSSLTTPIPQDWFMQMVGFVK